MNKTFTWHQISLRFVMEDVVNKNTFEKINVFEKREIDEGLGNWRLAYIE